MTPPSPRLAAIPRGFSFMELLLAVVILAVLLALGLPVLRQVLLAGAQARCVSNLKAIGAGLTAYANEHDGEIPPCATLPNGGFTIAFRKQTYWFDALNPYMGYPQYAATRNENFPDKATVGGEFPLAWQLCPAKKVVPLQRQCVGYGWNLANFGKDVSTRDKNPGKDTGFATRLSQVLYPGRTIIIGDSKDAEVRPEEVHEHRYLYDYEDDTRVPFAKRHRGRGSYLFLDGHVSMITPEVMDSPEGRWLLKKHK